ncbi:hypothetical protein K493DRAFT_309894 [Basidiobolus meristosporus CBS 931.73]|uniref:Uncharacterized protein n=1 Tax=Basidiobolus meristosporus CBS 931.73 TaxID=1314790 RepID=A0A1Y1ZDM6_9FUNG|nr:hypothetical protein K493DRAFT_309894 [Basidiobolus meristosporus CBS 931.73]|eukprot:ORY08306.1 hypothetical protein K493DRAFT_309894 [Basidiobolus meristosporus CBS 931.73]
MSSKKDSVSPPNSGVSTTTSKRTIISPGHSVVIEEVTLEQNASLPTVESYDISWEEWYTDVSDDDSDEEWLEAFFLGPKITEVDLFDEMCAELEEVTNAIIEEFEGHYSQPHRRRYVTFREYYHHEE